MADSCDSKDKLLIVCENVCYGADELQEIIQLLRPFYTLFLCTAEESEIGNDSDFTGGWRKETMAADTNSRLLSAVGMVLLTKTSDDLLKDLIEGRMHNPIAAVIMQALCLGLPVASLESLGDGKEVRSKAAAAYLNRRREQFTYCGIEPISLETVYSGKHLLSDDREEKQIFQSEIREPSESVKKSHSVITEADILQLRRENKKELLLYPGDCITPLAADTAKDLEIVVSIMI